MLSSNSGERKRGSSTISPVSSVWPVLYVSLALVLIITGFIKVFSPDVVINTSRELFPSLGTPVHTLIGSLLPVAELGLGIMLLLQWKYPLVLKGVTTLFGLFLIVSIYGQITGVDSDCGCFGGVVTSSFGWGMLTRNSLLFLGSLLLYNRELKKEGSDE